MSVSENNENMGEDNDLAEVKDESDPIPLGPITESIIIQSIN